MKFVGILKMSFLPSKQKKVHSSKSFTSANHGSSSYQAPGIVPHHRPCISMQYTASSPVFVSSAHMTASHMILACCGLPGVVVSKCGDGDEVLRSGDLDLPCPPSLPLLLLSEEIVGVEGVDGSGRVAGVVDTDEAGETPEVNGTGESGGA
ncbi:hypothetical protein NL108_006962 [Boleophthalmus pectinirostris]|nr:hypothetical protein NL108_006962 [Boleophthalmus pectinirostris]